VPELIGGSADLAPSNNTMLKGPSAFGPTDHAGRNFHYGIREHGMGGIMNGLALHGGVIPFGGTFFNFSDYMRGSVRLAALSGAHVVYSWTHDSVGLGEDGPTHQPVEHLAAMRAMPNLRTIRPADANETAQAWRVAVGRHGPTALMLTRQKVPVLEGTSDGEVERGAYVLVEAEGAPQIVLVGTGSEVWVCVDAAERLARDGIRARVVSMPSWELFAEQDEAYRDSVVPDAVPRLAVEAATTFGWDRYADEAVGIDRFGASAPGEIVLENLGLTPDNVAARAKALVAKKGPPS
jgi:transketolase